MTAAGADPPPTAGTPTARTRPLTRSARRSAGRPDRRGSRSRRPGGQRHRATRKRRLLHPTPECERWPATSPPRDEHRPDREQMQHLQCGRFGRPIVGCPSRSTRAPPWPRRAPSSGSLMKSRSLLASASAPSCRLSLPSDWPPSGVVRTIRTPVWIVLSRPTTPWIVPRRPDHEVAPKLRAGRKPLSILITASQRGDSPLFVAVLERIWVPPTGSRSTPHATAAGPGRKGVQIKGQLGLPVPTCDHLHCSGQGRPSHAARAARGAGAGANARLS